MNAFYTARHILLQLFLFGKKDIRKLVAIVYLYVVVNCFNRILRYYYTSFDVNLLYYIYPFGNVTFSVTLTIQNIHNSCLST